MSTITKEWLKQKIAEMEAARDDIPFGLDDDDSNTLAALRIALASIEAEPVAWRYRHHNGLAPSNWKVVDSEDECNVAPNYQRQALYTAPPAPVSVPDELSREEYKRRFMEEDNFDDTFRGGWNACRAAMLQGAENAEMPTTMQTAPAMDSSPKIAESPSGNSPVIPDGWKLAPIELTGDMTNAMSEAILDDLHNVDVWRSVLAAAPQQEVKQCT